MNATPYGMQGWAQFPAGGPSAVLPSVGLPWKYRVDKLRELDDLGMSPLNPPYLTNPFGGNPGGACAWACIREFHDLTSDGTMLGGVTTCAAGQSVPCICQYSVGDYKVELVKEVLEGHMYTLGIPIVPGTINEAVKALELNFACSFPHEEQHALASTCPGTDPEFPEEPNDHGDDGHLEASDAATEECMAEKLTASTGCDEGSICGQIAKSIMEHNKHVKE